MIPQVADRSGVTAYVGGETAAGVDTSAYLSGRLPWVIGTVIPLAFFLLMMVFRSVMIPIKAAAMNLLSMGAAYGVIVAVYQWGWLGSVFGARRAGPIDPWIPLLAAGAETGDFYQESIERLGRVRVRSELARAHLVYGEWLRRERRRGEARTELRTAHGMLEGIGMAAFAARARRELWATGETTRKRSVESHDELTAQELQIARLAREGLTNPEISRLFISARTVEYHLGKVFTKLGITSRAQLDRALS